MQCICTQNMWENNKQEYEKQVSNLPKFKKKKDRNFLLHFTREKRDCMKRKRKQTLLQIVIAHISDVKWDLLNACCLF